MIRTYAADDLLTIDVVGAATMIESPAVHALVTEDGSRNVRRLRVDLRDCTAMDSTFLGTLLSLRRHMQEASGTLTLVSPRVVELLVEMGLEDFYSIEIANRSRVPWTELSSARRGADTLQRRIVSAHEELARTPARGAHQFDLVVDELHKDVPSNGSLKDEPGAQSSRGSGRISRAPESSP